jgi:ferritin
VKIPAIAAPQTGFRSATAAVALALESEMRVTAQINAIVDLAVRQNDHLSRNMLEWFVSEQREEVATIDTLLRMVKRGGESGLMFVDNFILQGGLAANAPEGEAD